MKIEAISWHQILMIWTPFLNLWKISLPSSQEKWLSLRECKNGAQILMNWISAPLGRNSLLCTKEKWHPSADCRNQAQILTSSISAPHWRSSFPCTIKGSMIDRGCISKQCSVPWGGVGEAWCRPHSSVSPSEAKNQKSPPPPNTPTAQALHAPYLGFCLTTWDHLTTANGTVRFAVIEWSSHMGS